jgi:hypothetical protein
MFRILEFGVVVIFFDVVAMPTAAFCGDAKLMQSRGCS